MKVFAHVVVGAGTSGLACAIEAARAGVSTLVVDREESIGGTLWYSSGHMSGAGTRRQAALGIDDDPGKHLVEVQRLGRGLETATLVRRAIDGAATTLDWLEDEGFDTAPGMPIIAKSHEPYEIRRTLWGNAGGLSILKVLRRQIERPEVSGNLSFRLGLKLVDIDLDADPLVLTFAGESGTVTLHAREVTLATGGFGASPELLAEWHGQASLYGGGAFADGAVMKMLVDKGAEIVGKGTFLPTIGGFAQREDSNLIDWNNKLFINPQLRRVAEIILNVRGERFFNENAHSIEGVERAFLESGVQDYFVLGSFETLTQGKPVIGAEGSSVERQRALIEAIPGARTGPLAAILEDLGSFGRQARNEVEAIAVGTDRFGREWADRDLLKGEGYLVPCRTVVLRTWPGLRVQDDLRLVRDGKPHPCVRCLGEMLGGVQFSGASFASGMSLTPGLTLARDLGRTLAQKE